MNKTYLLKKSNREDKKFKVITPNNKVIHFGAKGYEDFTIHNNTKRLENYIARHGAQNQNWSDPETAGFWSKNLLWNKPTLKKSINDTQKKHNMIIKLSL